MKPVRLAPEALGELADAAVWYESREAGLGDRFLDEDGAAIRTSGVGGLIAGSSNAASGRFKSSPAEHLDTTHRLRYPHATSPGSGSVDKRERRRVRRTQLRKARARQETQAKQATARFWRVTDLHICDDALHLLCEQCGRAGRLDATRCPACRPRGASSSLTVPVEDPTAALRLGH